MNFAKAPAPSLPLVLCLVGLLGCVQSAEEIARTDQRLAGLRIDTIDGLRIVCLQAQPAGCPSTTGHPSIINETDRTTYVATEDKGASASLFRAGNGTTNQRAYVFASSYTNNRNIEVIVNAAENPDLNQARQKAVALSTELGRMPACVLTQVKEVKIQNSAGLGLDTGGVAAAAVSATSSIYIFEDFFNRSRQSRMAEEVLLHELAHLLFDNPTSGYATFAYKNAVVTDGVYVSRYAAGVRAVSPLQGDREDVAESFVAYFGAKFRSERVGAFFANSVRSAIPSRIAYFERFCPTA